MLRRCIIVPVLNVPRMPDEEMKGVDLTNTAYLHVKGKDGYGALVHDWLTPRAPLIASRTSVANVPVRCSACAGPPPSRRGL